MNELKYNVKGLEGFALTVEKQSLKKSALMP